MMCDRDQTHLIVATTISGVASRGRGCRISSARRLCEGSFFLKAERSRLIMMVTYDRRRKRMVKRRRSRSKIEV